MREIFTLSGKTKRIAADNVKWSVPLWVSIWFLLVITALFSRPLLPIDETRYVSVAWEMWHTNNFLVPHINGVPYSHKPPLLFYLIHLGWFLFGVNEWSARLTSPLIGLVNLFLTAYLARLIWPGNKSVARLVPFALLGFPLWAVFSTLTMFEMLLTFFSLLAAIGILNSDKKNLMRGWGLVSIAIGGGLLAKGPVILIYVLPLGLLAPWWANGLGELLWRRWYGGLSIAVVIGVMIALVWALPAAKAGGLLYGNAILWGQTVGRMVNSFAHSRPLWWYLPLIPIVFYPWYIQKNVLTRLYKIDMDKGIKFCISWILSAIFFLSLVDGKQVHYLIPLLPPAALLITRTFTEMSFPEDGRGQWSVIAIFLLTAIFLIMIPVLDLGSSDIPIISNVSPGWGFLYAAIGILIIRWKPKNLKSLVKGVCTAMAGYIILLQMGPLREIAPAYDLSNMASRLAQLQENGREVAIFPSKYSDQFQFAGRLKKELINISSLDNLKKWSAKNPNEYVVIFSNSNDQHDFSRKPEYRQPFRGKWMSLWSTMVLEQEEE